MIEQIGQLFITGFDTPEPSDEFLEFFKSQNVGGVILFENNCTPHHRAEEAIKRIISASPKSTPLIGVDQEGGRVCRFRGAPAEFGAASKYGKNKNIELYKEQFSRAAYYLYSLGINLIFGPVADIELNAESECLKGRTFGKSPANIIPFVENNIRISRKAGLLTCLKHFPGLGAAQNDPHQEISVADYDYQTFLNREALTFMAGIEAGADMVMSTHMILPKIDRRPATASEIIIEQLLRDKLNFDGIIITDDLLMKGADTLGNYGVRAMKAFKAGHDLLLFGKNYRAAHKAIEYFKNEYQRGHLKDMRIKESLERISGIKSRLSLMVP